VAGVTRHGMHFGVTSGRLPETLLERESPQADCHACKFVRAGDQIRTGDPHFGKVMRARIGCFSTSVDSCGFPVHRQYFKGLGLPSFLSVSQRRVSNACPTSVGRNTLAGMQETWASRDLPVLRALVEAFDDPDRYKMSHAEIEDGTGLDSVT
jgi:hypothetical protein